MHKTLLLLTAIALVASTAIARRSIHDAPSMPSDSIIDRTADAQFATDEYHREQLHERYGSKGSRENQTTELAVAKSEPEEPEMASFTASPFTPRYTDGRSRIPSDSIIDRDADAQFDADEYFRERLREERERYEKKRRGRTSVVPPTKWHAVEPNGADN